MYCKRGGIDAFRISICIVRAVDLRLSKEAIIMGKQLTLYHPSLLKDIAKRFYLMI